MSVVAINTLTVPEAARGELEKRFAARKHSVDGSPGFEGFQLLRPVSGGDQYFVYTQWATREDFENWRSARKPSHESNAKEPVSEQANLLEFEVVDLGD
ncbi:antibiotic biosynthesis monooxygenase family protein [Brevibacterium sp. UCMA 11752]|uniref:antibiotic biosynthesis monooxygenase family protein n=1 Tax=Brevibacterium sp. UCMA 11752 TaxID=2745946 RepID=UPI001F3E73FE|nr:antibiotic biosynthesis monooxygenase [Brevibacterium sp. UCMA 11752]MCF2585948.1 antibiotic biosynthesis monooxygenase [Brevibacterium sp. UCMA 11752]